LNQVVKQETPDAGISLFWYDGLGRLTLSQNAEQRKNNLFSYTSFDNLGRTVEVGIGRTPLDYPDSTNWTSQAAADAYQSLAEAANLKELLRGKNQITRTYYDEKPLFMAAIPNFTAQNVRNRVAVTTFNENDATETNYNYASFYTYDVAGNVQTLIHHVQELRDLNYTVYTRNNTYEGATHEYKRLDYEYDLISGKVNRLWYQRGAVDQFGYQYQ
jgi:hypothetical protein